MAIPGAVVERCPQCATELARTHARLPTLLAASAWRRIGCSRAERSRGDGSRRYLGGHGGLARRVVAVAGQLEATRADRGQDYRAGRQRAAIGGDPDCSARRAKPFRANGRRLGGGGAVVVEVQGAAGRLHQGHHGFHDALVAGRLLDDVGLAVRPGARAVDLCPRDGPRDRTTALWLSGHGPHVYSGFGSAGAAATAGRQSARTR